jgi:hypothetical protein
LPKVRGEPKNGCGLGRNLDWFVPISVCDEKILSEEATADEIAKAKHLPFNQMLGIMSYGASSCEFEMKHAVSRLGSRGDVRWGGSGLWLSSLNKMFI